MKYAKILSSGIYIPRKIMRNDEFEKLTGTTIDPYYTEQIGINHRHISSDEETPTYMASEAAKMALERANVTADQVDLIIVGTDTPEAISPPNAPRVQHLIGASKTEPLAFDVNASCANGALMLDMAARYISLGDYKYVLVIGTYAMTKFLSWKYPWEALFSDGAGAILLTSHEEPGYLGSVARTDGSWWHNWGIYMGAGTMNLQGIDRGLHRLDLRAPYPATVNEEGWPMLIEKLMNKCSLTQEDVGMIFFTQVRKKSIMKVMETLNMPQNKTHTVMEKYGYTGSACVYMAYHDAVECGKLERLKGKSLIFLTSGVGFQQVAVAFKF
ncbi:MAG: ketoacyl-ACP synthase III [Thermotogaceae bacterium]|nr:ketoacyl-ACP synthase III [Thermotogaceae bacterium]